MRTDVNWGWTLIYLLSWIFIGNFTFLNLFIAILLDGFCGEDAKNDLNDALLTSIAGISAAMKNTG